MHYRPDHSSSHMRAAEIQSWAASVSEARDSPCETAHQQKRPRSRSPDRAAHLPSPPLEHHDSTPDEPIMSMSPPKKRRVDTPELESNLTPRARRIASAFDGADELHRSAPSSPSKSASISRSSSPGKQITNAGLQPSGFDISDFESQFKPSSLQIVQQELRRIQTGHGILPASLRTKLVNDEEIFPFHFGNDDAIFPSPPGGSDRSRAFQYPPLERVHLINQRAKECVRFDLGESSWNLEVHGPILEWLLREAPGSNGPLDFRYCTTASIVPEYRPINAPSTMVDFCLAIKVDPEDKKIIDNLRRVRPGLSISHTDWGDLDHRPVAISIETKAAEEYRRALLQVATWHAAQWRCLRYGGAVPQNIEFLGGIIVSEHEWYFVATVLGYDSKPTTLAKLPLGSTETVLGIYRLFASLHSLRQWGENVFWPAFRIDVLGLPGDAG